MIIIFENKNIFSITYFKNYKKYIESLSLEEKYIFKAYGFSNLRQNKTKKVYLLEHNFTMNRIFQIIEFINSNVDLDNLSLKNKQINCYHNNNICHIKYI